MTPQNCFRQAFLRRCASLIVLPLLFAGHGSAASAQTAGSAEPGQNSFTFDVVSIHPSGQGGGIGFGPSLNGFHANHLSVWTLIAQAYVPDARWSPDLIKGAPGWASNEPFDVHAKVRPEDLDRWQHQKDGNLLREGMRDLLATRFRLRVHELPAREQGFALLTAAHGSKLVPAASNDAQVPHGVHLPDGGVASPGNYSPNNRQWTFTNASIKDLLWFLSTGAHARIEDRTELRGRYNFVLVRREDVSNVRTSSAAEDPSDFWELGDLGLRTIPATLPATAVVVDHIEEPSPN